MKLELWQIALGAVLLIGAFVAGIGVVIYMSDPEPEEAVALSEVNVAESHYQLTDIA